MQRITKKVRSKKHPSPILSIIPWLLLATLVQGIINIFSQVHFSIVWNDVLFVVFFLLIFSVTFYFNLPVNTFQNKQVFWKLLRWTLLGKSYINVHLENGAISSDLPLKNQRKLLCVDPNSAFAIFHSDHKLTFHNAGFYCLEKDQTILAVFDLRIQSILIPDNVINKTPGTDSGDSMIAPQSDPVFLTATTKDGYQVGAVFWIMVKYDCEFGCRENPYGFDAAVLEKALGENPTGSSILIDPQGLVLEELTNVFQSVWQNNVSQYDLLQIIPQETDKPTVLENIENQIKKELTQQENSNPITRSLSEKGLRVLNLALLQFWLSQETDIAVQHHWQPSTMQTITSLQQERQQKAHIYRELGEMQAVYTYLKQNGRIA